MSTIVAILLAYSRRSIGWIIWFAWFALVTRVLFVWFLPYLGPVKHGDAVEVWRFILVAGPVLLVAVAYLQPLIDKRRVTLKKRRRRWDGYSLDEHRPPPRSRYAVFKPDGEVKAADRAPPGAI
jgi:hypothetical protein